MSDTTVTANPFSPFATADPDRRHIIPVPRLLADAGVTPRPGTLAGTGCGQLAVVPADVVMVEPGHPLPPIACSACVAAMKADRIDEPRAELHPCDNCELLTIYDGICGICRQKRHDEWWASQGHQKAECLCAYGWEGDEFTRFPYPGCPTHDPENTPTNEAEPEPVEECEICRDGQKDCGNCDGSGEDMYGGTDEGCDRCGGRGEYIPDHCCVCGGSPYCQCCGKCGSPNAGTCGCTITVQRADGTTRELN